MPAPPDPPLVLATRNAHKLREFTRILAPFGITVEPLPDDVELPPEDGDSFEANARPKAYTAATALDRPAVADDSGIESAALNGRPGVRSARFAGEHATDGENLAKLLAEAPAGSDLRYVCVVAYVDPRTGTHRTFEGTCDGTLAAKPAGAGGFGYDPAFVPRDAPGGGARLRAGTPGDPLTFAELSDAQKDALSHRGRALRAFARWLTETPG